MNFDEIEGLRRAGVRRYRWADGAEVEFDKLESFFMNAGAKPQAEQPDAGTSPIEQMPSRAELRREMEKLLPDGAEGAPAVTP